MHDGDMKTQTTTTTCDLCGWGSHYSRPEDFTARLGFDFCRWCVSGPVRETSCGEHTVTVADGSWTCDCGMTMAMLTLTLYRYVGDLRVFDAVPDFPSATAAIHVQTPKWPATH